MPPGMSATIFRSQAHKAAFSAPQHADVTAPSIHRGKKEPLMLALAHNAQLCTGGATTTCNHPGGHSCTGGSADISNHFFC